MYILTALEIRFQLLFCCLFIVQEGFLFNLLSNVQGRLSMDHEATCTCMLCYAAYAWLSPRFDFSFLW